MNAVSATVGVLNSVSTLQDLFTAPVNQVLKWVPEIRVIVWM